MHINFSKRNRFVYDVENPRQNYQVAIDLSKTSNKTARGTSASKCRRYRQVFRSHPPLFFSHTCGTPSKRGHLSHATRETRCDGPARPHRRQRHHRRRRGGVDVAARLVRCRGRRVAAHGERGEVVGDVGDVTLRSLEEACLLYTSPSPRDATLSRMPSSA